MCSVPQRQHDQSASDAVNADQNELLNHCSLSCKAGWSHPKLCACCWRAVRPVDMLAQSCLGKQRNTRTWKPGSLPAPAPTPDHCHRHPLDGTAPLSPPLSFRRQKPTCGNCVRSGPHPLYCFRSERGEWHSRMPTARPYFIPDPPCTPLRRFADSCSCMSGAAQPLRTETIHSATPLEPCLPA